MYNVPVMQSPINCYEIQLRIEESTAAYFFSDVSIYRNFPQYLPLVLLLFCMMSYLCIIHLFTIYSIVYYLLYYI
jgi:hypothetical protein